MGLRWICSFISRRVICYSRLVGDSIMANKESFFVWDYGGVMVMDGLWQANETFGLPYADVIGQ